MTPATAVRPVAPRARPPVADRGPAAPATAPARWPGALRALAFAALVVQGALAWSRQLAPEGHRVALQGAALAFAVGAVAAAAGRLRHTGLRRTAVGVACLAGVCAALPAAGMPVQLLGWRNWGVLADGVGEGIGALPDLNIPYRGLDDWVRWIVMTGAGLLGVVAAVLAFAPGAPCGRARRSLGAAVALGLLYGVAIVERDPTSPFASGLEWALLLAVFLGADRLAAIRGARPRVAAAAVAAVTMALAAIIAPQLDGARPIVDYRSFGQDIARGKQDVFDWNHSYSPLRWPRDGRELLRVKAKTAAYWKTVSLPRFDGERWLQADSATPTLVDTPLPRDRPDWYEDIAVTVRALRSSQYATAGWTSRIFDQSRRAQPAGSGSFRTVGRPLKTADTYSASVYVPKPTSQELRDAGTVYPDYVRSALTMELPQRVGGPGVGAGNTTVVEFAPFGSTDPRPITYLPRRAGVVGGTDILAASGYRRTWALAQELRARATSPFALLRSIRRRVQSGASYTETPRQGRVPLDAFLWDTKEGYCQQFSGAMALLLRMAGVPARVASGFAPGQFDASRGTYVVRDLDAHSWVEAFFPGIGWVTFDPTPTVAPPNSQSSGDGGDTVGDGGSDASARADVTRAAGSSGSSGAGTSASSGGGSVLPWAGLACLVAAALAGGAWWWRRPHEPLAPVDELRRALRRSGRPAAPGLTLRALERTLVGAPTAQGYVRELSRARYAGGGDGPSHQERAALRRELGTGLGPAGRARAWWALPPRLRRRR